MQCGLNCSKHIDKYKFKCILKCKTKLGTSNEKIITYFVSVFYGFFKWIFSRNRSKNNAISAFSGNSKQNNAIILDLFPMVPGANCCAHAELAVLDRSL